MPNGWFIVARADELQPGEVMPLYLFARHLVLFRTEDGAPRLMDAHCPHLGAHLGVGGRVRGDTIQCPFHGWRFQGDTGTCVEVPYDDVDFIPRKAHARAYPTIERNQMIWAWHHLEDGEPFYDVPVVPEFDDPEWSDIVVREFPVATCAQEMAENNYDTVHFQYVHGSEAIPRRRSSSSTATTSGPSATDGAFIREGFGLGLGVLRVQGCDDVPVHRIALTVGFGGLLSIMALAGIDALHVLQQFRGSEDRIRRRYLSDNRVLNDIRSDVYVSGTYVRDYLLEPDTLRADAFGTSLEDVRRRMEASLDSYGRQAVPAELRHYTTLRAELTDYWATLAPVLHWDAAERRRSGYSFLRDEVFPRRQAMLALAGRIAALNDQQLDGANQEVVALLVGFQTRLLVTLMAALALGLGLALFTMRKILKLEDQAQLQYREAAEARGQLAEPLSALGSSAGNRAANRVARAARRSGPVAFRRADRVA